MWKVGTLVCSKVLNQRIFFNHFSTKRKFRKCQFSDAFFQRDVLQYGLSLCIV